MNSTAKPATPQPDLPLLKGEKERMRGLIFAIAMALLMMHQPAMAKDFSYSPDHCAFTITFPEKPVIEESCKASPLREDDNDKGAGQDKNCHEIVSFNKVFSADSSLHVRASCNSSSNKQYMRYSGADMKEALEKLLATEDVSDHKASFDRLSDSDVKRAGFLGYGKRKDTPATIIGQLWLSPKSMFTLQVEMTGTSDKKADAMLASILRSLQVAGNDTPDDEKAETDSAAKGHKGK